jgi:hypothetical protein
MSKLQNTLEFGAGAGVGALIGLIAGLSASAVVSAVIGALSAGLLVMLGFGKPSPDSSTTDTPRSLATWRTLGFGSFCSICLILGILLRTYDVLAPSIESEKHKLEASNVFSKDEVHQIVLLKQFGLSVPNKDAAKLEIANPKTPAGMGVSAGFLFSGKTEICNVVRRDQYPDTASYVQSLQVHGGDFAAFANALAHESPQNQDAIAVALSNLLCK